MTREDFDRCWFQLVDVNTNSIDAELYAQWILGTVQRIAQRREIKAQRSATAIYWQWKEDMTILQYTPQQQRPPQPPSHPGSKKDSAKREAASAKRHAACSANRTSPSQVDPADATSAASDEGASTRIRAITPSLNRAGRAARRRALQQKLGSQLGAIRMSWSTAFKAQLSSERISTLARIVEIEADIEAAARPIQPPGQRWSPVATSVSPPMRRTTASRTTNRAGHEADQRSSAFVARMEAREEVATLTPRRADTPVPRGPTGGTTHVRMHGIKLKPILISQDEAAPRPHMEDQPRKEDPDIVSPANKEASPARAERTSFLGSVFGRLRSSLRGSGLRVSQTNKHLRKSLQFHLQSRHSEEDAAIFRTPPLPFLPRRSWP